MYYLHTNVDRKNANMKVAPKSLVSIVVVDPI